MNLKNTIKKIINLDTLVSNAPLVVFRIIFGALMLFSTVRFWALGWIEDHYIRSKVQFKYFGFEWVELLSPTAMYALHIGMLLGALGILLGLWYRWSAFLFFACFTYVELIDLTYYLNHYYFVSLVAFLLIFVPTNRRFSLDAWLNPAIFSKKTKRWTILIFQFQIALVYIFAGFAKMNYTWLIEALPLRIWLPANNDLPIIGSLLAVPAMPWIFAWAGMLYDTFIVFFLSWKKTRVLAYLSVLFFHILTGWMFQIGVFPIVMIFCTLLFFGENFHEKLLSRLSLFFRKNTTVNQPINISFLPKKIPAKKTRNSLLAAFVAFQLLFPLRYLLHDGNVFWHEQGYRFSWRVMLMEKAGTATFYVKDGTTGKKGAVNNGDFLCAHQEKQMSMQPDMILQFGQFLGAHYKAQGVKNPKVYVDAFVTLNGAPSKRYIDPNADLLQLKDSWGRRDWVLDFKNLTKPH